MNINQACVKRFFFNCLTQNIPQMRHIFPNSSQGPFPKIAGEGPVNGHSKKDPKIYFQDGYLLNAGQK